MSITNWPQEDRPREKLLQRGAQYLTDSELIAIFLKCGTKKNSAVDIAKQLLVEHKSLKQLLRTPMTTLLQTPGIGQVKYATLQAAIELGKRYLSEIVPTGAILKNASVAQRFLSDRLRDYTNEVFCCLFLDNQFRLIQFEELFHGTVNEATIYPREVVRRALLHHAVKVILAHNHPSGVALPSEADKALTRHIKQALALIDVRVVDHIIIGHTENFSFSEAGLL